MKGFVLGLIVSTLWCLASTSSSSAMQAQDEAILRRCVTEMLTITPGTAPFAKEFEFRGSPEEPARKVEMQHALTVATVEATQELWQLVMGENPSRWKGDRNSVEMVSFADSVLFCEKLTKRLRDAGLIETDAFVRLPTELEWEYAARAGTDSAYSFGDDPALLGDHAWFTGNAAGNDPPVAAKKANPAGLYDVHGYLWEWCLPGEGVAKNLDSETTWSQLEGDAVLRSGSWKDAAELLRSDTRRPAPQGLKDDAVGLRLVLVGKRKLAE